MALNDHLHLFEEQRERNIDSGLIDGTHIMLPKKKKETETDHRSYPYVTVCGEGSCDDTGVHILPKCEP